MSLVCSQCNEQLDPEMTICPSCDTPITQNNICATCGKELKSHWKKCPYCQTATGTGISQTNSSTNKVDMNMSMGGFTDASQPSFINNLIDLPTGESIGSNPYVVQKKIGMGGFGAVYQVVDKLMNQTKAAKVLPLIRQDSLDSILQEYQSRSKIDNFEHVLRADQPQPFNLGGQKMILYPMELAEGGSLRDRLRELKINKNLEERQNQVVEYFRQMCLGVTACHKAGIVHMDIKPENFLLVGGKVKITDFGIARFARDQFGNNPDTIMGQGIGTPRYMSPEQFLTTRQKDIGLASDIYSLGIVFYEMLDGDTPFDGRNPVELKEKHLNVDAKKIDGANEKWWKIIERCIQKKAENRYANLDDVIRDLERLIKGGTTSAEVACKKCGHITVNTNAKFCEKCNSDIKYLFDKCRKCGSAVRIDVDVCPDCQYQIGAERIFNERKKQLEILQDEDPNEAMKLLKEMLQASFHGDEGRDHFVKLMATLRDKSEESLKIISQAESPEMVKQPEKAVVIWKKVIKIFPRHKMALTKISEIEGQITGLGKLQESVTSFVAQAKFKDAITHINDALIKLPNKELIRSLLDDVNIKETSFNKAFTLAVKNSKDKLLREANKNILDALKISPLQSESKTIITTVSKILNETSKLAETVSISIESANFDKAKDALEEISTLQSDHEQFDRLTQGLDEKKKKYSDSVAKAESATEQGDLASGLDHWKSALKLCPQSTKAKNAIGRIESSHEGVSKLVTETERQIKSAEFDKATAGIAEINSLWKQYDTQKLKSTLSSKKAEYSKHYADAEKSFDAKLLDKAESSLLSALKECPQSKPGKILQDKIEKAKILALSNLRNAESYCSSADFAKAKEELSSAKNIWVGNDKIHNEESRIASVETKYSNFISEANEKLKLKKFSEARSAAQSASYECAQSAVAKSLISNIEIAEKNKFIKEIEQKALTKQIVGWLAATVPSIIGLYIFFKTDLRFYVGIFGFLSDSLTFHMPSMVGKIVLSIGIILSIMFHNDGKLHRSIYYSPSLGFSSIEAKFAVASIILFSVGLSLLFLPGFVTFLIVIGWALIGFGMS